MLDGGEWRYCEPGCMVCKGLENKKKLRTHANESFVTIQQQDQRKVKVIATISQGVFYLERVPKRVAPRVVGSAKVVSIQKDHLWTIQREHF